MTTLTAGKIGSSRRSALKALVITWMESYRTAREQRRAIAELRTLDRAMLRDIGIDASEITSLVRTQPEPRRMSHDRI